jgi:hypothetical protein
MGGLQTLLTAFGVSRKSQERKSQLCVQLHLHFHGCNKNLDFNASVVSSILCNPEQEDKYFPSFHGDRLYQPFIIGCILRYMHPLCLLSRLRPNERRARNGSAFERLLKYGYCIHSVVQYPSHQAPYTIVSMGDDKQPAPSVSTDEKTFIHVVAYLQIPGYAQIVGKPGHVVVTCEIWLWDR